MAFRGSGLRRWFGSAAALLVLSALGCGGSGTSTVTGKVTLNGKTVVWGSVTLVDEKGQFYTGPIDLQGNYKIEKVPSGAVKIGVFSQNPDPPKEAKGPAGGPKTGGAGGGAGFEDPREKLGLKKDLPPDLPKPPPGTWFPIPGKYTDPTASGLTGQVKSGSTELNIDLK